MGIEAIDQDPGQGIIAVRASYHVPPERLWQLWADPRQLERWWGPPTYPAEVLEHRLEPGGAVAYAMTGPEGDRQPCPAAARTRGPRRSRRRARSGSAAPRRSARPARGWWQVLVVEPPHLLVVEDGFADADGAPVADLPVTVMRVDIAATGDGGSSMALTSTFASPEAMQQTLDMGVIEGLRGAVGQIDGILAMPAG